MASIRLAVVADIHHGRDTPTKRGSAALPLLERFIDRANDGGIEAVIELGDRISDQGQDADRSLQKNVAVRFGRLRAPRHHVAGNHDVAALSLEQNASLLDAPLGSRTVEMGGMRIVFWQPDVALTPGRGFHLAEGDLERLGVLLAGDDRPTLLVSHVPLSGHTQTGNYYFENNPSHATYGEIAEIRRVLAEAPCPIVAIAGHVHWNSLTVVDGTPHITLQSLTETFTCGEPSGCTGVLEIDGDAMRWTVSGREPFAVTLPWRQSKQRWKPPTGRFGQSWDSAARPARALI